MTLSTKINNKKKKTKKSKKKINKNKLNTRIQIQENNRNSFFTYEIKYKN